jgi:preprotein translocase subunit SecY
MSFLDTIIGLMPTIKKPKKVPTTKQKLIWTFITLVLFFILGSITLIGLNISELVNLGFYEMVSASSLGSLISLGIGPIVVSSIILQLLVGVKIINLDFSNPTHRAKFSGLQKILAIVLSIVEAILATTKGLLVALPGFTWILVIQIVLGSIILIYLDDLVSKYGIGSGIGLFIAAGVTQTIFWSIFAIPAVAQGIQGGLLFSAIEFIQTGATTQLLSQVLLPILMTFVVFLAVVYAESLHINIPLTVGRSGMGAKYPVKFLYVSNMPVILAATLFANFNMLANALSNVDFIAVISNYLTAPQQILQSIIAGAITGPMILQAFVYLVVFMTACVIFGKLWVQIGGQSVENVAQQLQRSGMSIPGFRRDKRVIVSVLNRYIPTIVVLGSLFVGFLAVFADMTGALGTGTGILLTVGIIYRFYEQLAKDQAFESSALLKQITGKK